MSPVIIYHIVIEDVQDMRMLSSLVLNWK